jgi:hypothetical protein
MSLQRQHTFSSDDETPLSSETWAGPANDRKMAEGNPICNFCSILSSASL